ncbi:MAG: HD-GYP domain-containing protein [Candidatus Caldatribacteriota bacterium]
MIDHKDNIVENNKFSKLKKKLLQLDALNKISFDLIHTIDLDILLNKIINYATKIVEGEAASILLLDKEKRELSFQASLGKKSREIRAYKVKVGEGIAGWVAENGIPLIINDVVKDKRWKRIFDEKTKFETKSIICVPLILENEILGVMEVINKKENKPFDKDDEETLTSFAHQAVVVLRNVNIIKDLNNYFVNIIEILIQALESDPLGPKGYFMKVARLATQIGNKLGITGKEYNNLYYAALLHNIGKLKTTHKIDLSFKKRENLTPIIQKEISMHPVVGANMLKQIHLFKDLAPIVLYHHENYDGSGYPRGLKGEDIPLASRIIAVVEDFTNMLYNNSKNIYIENSLPDKEALKRFYSFTGKKYDPKVINALKEIIKV